MCGIAGFYGFRDDKLIKKISQQLEHRGPDGEGLFINDTITLLNRRLAIIDIKTGNQPVYNEDKSIVVVYNGEIYNYRELKELLTKKGHRFYTQSDTEVIVHSYEEWQEDCFGKFNGMFAIALYDKKKEKLILARDHFGIKPLYYTFVNPKKRKFLSRVNSSPEYSGSSNTNSQKNFVSSSAYMIFSSEIKPIFYSGLIPKKPNDRIIYRYLKFRVHDDQKETFFEGINRLMPGEIMIVQSQKSKVESYTDIRKELLTSKGIKKLNDEEIKQFRSNLIKAIKYRLISDVPVGTCLSGGLDSSTVVTVVDKLLMGNVNEAKSVGKMQKTFSAVFPNSSNDEEKYINKLITAMPDIKSNKIYPQPEKFIQEIKEFVVTQEEPTISTGPYAQYKVMQMAAKHVKVLLDGQGSDEMMAGYLPYYFVYFRQLIKEKKYLILLKEILSSSDVILKYMHNRVITFIGIKKNIDFKLLLNERFTTKYKNEKFNITNDNLKERLVEDVFYNSLQSLLRYEDRNSMRFSIEGRVPFLDFNLIKFIFSLDDEAIIKDGWNKNILRQAMSNLLPEEIIKRRNKIGFTTPEYEWFMKIKNEIYVIFASKSFGKRKYFNQHQVLKAFQRFIEGKIDDTMVFWRLLNLELWLREFFDDKYHNNYKSYRNADSNFISNKGKKIEIRVNNKIYLRFPIKTEIFKKGDDISKLVGKYVNDFFINGDLNLASKNWFVVLSEKIVAISQGRSYFIWDIKPGFLAKLLSKFVTKTSYGIGLGSPWTMQLAINEVGLARILLASFVALVSKPLRLKGNFYRIAGEIVRSIDGPTEYSLYPSNVSAKLGPKNPQQVAENIKLQISNFLGAVIIDANDLGQNVLGNSTNLNNSLIEKIFSDNPMGQADEQTPVTLVFY